MDANTTDNLSDKTQGFGMPNTTINTNVDDNENNDVIEVNSEVNVDDNENKVVNEVISEVNDGDNVNKVVNEVISEVNDDVNPQVVDVPTAVKSINTSSAPQEKTQLEIYDEIKRKIGSNPTYKLGMSGILSISNKLLTLMEKKYKTGIGTIKLVDMNDNETEYEFIIEPVIDKDNKITDYKIKITKKTEINKETKGGKSKKNRKHKKKQTKKR